MDPISVGLKVGSGLLSDMFGMNSVRQQQDFQARENEKTRKFNSEEALKARQFQEKMWNAENEYNAPNKVVSRLMEAGINPALAYGGFADSASIGGASMGSSVSDASTHPYDFVGLRSAGNAYNDAIIAESQARLNNANAQKVETETPWIDTMMNLDKQLKQQQFDIGKLVPAYKKALTDLANNQSAESKANQAKLKTQVEDIKKNWQLLQGKIEEQDLINANLDIQLKYADEKQRTEIRQMVSEIQRNFADAHLSENEAYLLGATMSYSIEIAKSKMYQEHSKGYEAWVDEKVLRKVYGQHSKELPEKKWEAIRYSIDSLKRSAYGNQLDFLNCIFGGTAAAGTVMLRAGR